MEYTVNESFTDEQEIHLRDILMVLSVRKWAVILGAAAVILGAAFYLIMAKPVYEAEVTMLYEKSNPTTALLDNIDFRLLQTDLELDAQKAFLMSPIVLNEARTRLLKEYGLILTDKQIEKSLDLTSPRGTKVLKLTAKAGTPSTAALIANTVASVYIEKSTERKRSDLDNAVSFLQSQLSAIDKRLEKSYEELAKFKEKEGLVATPTTEGLVVPGLLQKLGQMQEQLEETKIEIGLTRASLDSVKNLIEDKKKQLDPSVQILTAPGGLTPQIDLLRQQILNLESELNAKKEEYTERHQEVVELERRLKSAQQRLREEIAKLSKIQGESLDPLSEWQNLILQQIQFEVKLKELEEKKKLFEAKIGKFKADHPDLVTKDVQLMQLEKERRMLEETYKTLKTKLEEMRLMKQMRTADVDIVKEATEPRLPIKPKIKLTVALAVVLGVMFGVGLAFLWEYMDNTIKTKEEVERLTGLSVIGIIPKLDKDQLKDLHLEPLPNPGSGGTGGGDKPGTAIVKRRRKSYQRQIEELVKRKLTNLKPRNPIVESYRAIRSNIRYATVDGNVRSVLITSSLPGEGKSLTVANLAITFAKSGARTILLDCDLHRPKLHYMFGVEKSPGISELLTGQVEGESLEEKISRIIRETEVENLYLITSGKLPPNPGDLLASERVEEILENLKSNFDMVLVDSPPLGLVSDTSVLATRMDSTILVIRAGQTRRPSVVQAKEMLEHLGANIFGAVINELDARSRRYSDYYYYYSKYSRDYYSPDEEEEA
jgi:tyrosine-protein kinase Etk/Wzc